MEGLYVEARPHSRRRRGARRAGACSCERRRPARPGRAARRTRPRRGAGDDALQPARGPLDRPGRGALPHAPPARRVVGVGRRGRRRGARRRNRRVARRQPRVDRRIRRVPVPASRRRAAAARLRALVTRHDASVAPARRGWPARDRDRGRAGMPTRRSSARPRGSHRPCGSPSSTTPPARTAYTPAQAAAIVRGIEVYHVLGNGWNDIGYNFLVDRFGTVYEGRAGGITRNVIGAHSEGFNSGTVGIALIGNFTSTKPPPAMQAALVRLLAWRLDVAHVDPLSRVVYTLGREREVQGGQDGHPAGDLRSPRHRPERVPRERRLRAPAGDREARVGHGIAEALLPDRGGGARRPHPLPGPCLVRAGLDGLDRRRAREDRRLGDRPRPPRRLDVELRGCGSGPLHLDDRRSGRPIGDGDDRHRPPGAGPGALAHEPGCASRSSSHPPATGPAARRPSRSPSARRQP